MTKLEWALANRCKGPAAAMNHVTIDDRFIIDNLCPSEYGLSDTEHCYATACADCWDEEIWG